MARNVPNIIAENETPASSAKMNANLSYLAGEIDAVESAANTAITAVDNKTIDKVEDDTTPKLGGNLNANSKNITGAAAVETTDLKATKLTGDLNANSKVISNANISNANLSSTTAVGFNAEYDNGNSGTTKTIDLSKAQHQKITLTGNCTVTFSNPTVTVYTLRIIQDATGSRTLSLPSGKWAGGVAYVPSSSANAEDLLSIYYNGSAYYYSVINVDFSVPA